MAPWAGVGRAGDAARVEMGFGFGFVLCRFSVFIPPTLTAESNIPPDVRAGTQVQELRTRTELFETMLVMEIYWLYRKKFTAAANYINFHC